MKVVIDSLETIEELEDHDGLDKVDEIVVSGRYNTQYTITIDCDDLLVLCDSGIRTITIEDTKGNAARELRLVPA
jgi:hypothetical protein